jgi:hypothetical protein
LVPVPKAKILKMPKRDEHRKTQEASPKPPLAEIVEFPNDPETQPDYSTVQRWLRLADEVLKGSLEPKKA